MTLYKTISAAGASIHGGSLQWSLPVDGQPGEWHEVTGDLRKCHRGLHLTDEPARWWKPGCRVFEAEAEGVVDSLDSERKIVCRRARLLRELTTEADLAAVRIFISGQHTVADGTSRAYGSASVVASGSASVVASGSASVVAYGSASVVAYGSASVVAYGSASVVASGSASVVAYGSASVRAYGSASVVAYGSASVVAYGSASVVAYGSASVAPSHDVTVISWRGKPGAALVDRVVWIDRSVTPPVVYQAEVYP